MQSVRCCKSLHHCKGLATRAQRKATRHMLGPPTHGARTWCVISCTSGCSARHSEVLSAAPLSLERALLIAARSYVCRYTSYVCPAAVSGAKICVSIDSSVYSNDRVRP